MHTTSLSSYLLVFFSFYRIIEIRNHPAPPAPLFKKELIVPLPNVAKNKLLQKVVGRDGSLQPSCHPRFMTPQYLRENRKSAPKRLVKYDPTIPSSQMSRTHIFISNRLTFCVPLWEELLGKIGSKYSYLTQYTNW